MPGDPNHSASVGARPSWLPHPVLPRGAARSPSTNPGVCICIPGEVFGALWPLSNSVGLLVALEALPDTGTAPSHRSEGNVEDGAGAWPGLLYLVIPLFSSATAPFSILTSPRRLPLT
jgi:hypothetical protein